MICITSKTLASFVSLAGGQEFREVTGAVIVLAVGTMKLMGCRRRLQLPGLTQRRGRYVRSRFLVCLVNASSCDGATELLVAILQSTQYSLWRGRAGR